MREPDVVLLYYRIDTSRFSAMLLLNGYDVMTKQGCDDKHSTKRQRSREKIENTTRT